MRAVLNTSPLAIWFLAMRASVSRLQINRAVRDGFAKLDGFGGDIDHPRFAAFIDVGELFHPPMATILRPGM